MRPVLSDVFLETSARDRAMDPSSGSNVIPRQAPPGPAGLRPHTCEDQVLARLYSGEGVGIALLVMYPQSLKW